MKWNCSQQAVLNTLTLEQQIQLVYVGLLERGADSGGLAYWINDINSGFTIEKLRDNVVNSQPMTWSLAGECPVASRQPLFQLSDQTTGIINTDP